MSSVQAFRLDQGLAVLLAQENDFVQEVKGDIPTVGEASVPLGEGGVRTFEKRKMGS